MTDASHGQSSFGGGEWDTSSQGRVDHPWHHKALATSVNAVSTENEAWVKRSGTKFLGPTYKRLTGWCLPFEADSAHRYCIVLTTDGTTGWAHFFKNDAILTNASNTITASSSASGVLSLTTNTATGWAVGDQIIFDNLSSLGLGYLNRWLLITAISGTSITAKDDLGNAFSFDSNVNGLVGATVSRIARFTTGITSGLVLTQIVNLGVLTYSGPICALLCNFSFPTQLIQLTAGTNDSVSVGNATFVDGPYLDPQSDTGTVSGYSGSITFTPVSTTFSASDVGRSIRLFSQPAAWNSGTAYSTGNLVTYNSQWWQWIGGTAYAGVTGVTPGTLYTATGGTQVLLWAPIPTAGQWAYGTITAQATTSCTVNLTTNLNSANGSTISTWRLGSYSGSIWPGTGILHGGRLYLGGGREGRLSASMSGIATSGVLLTFSPTDTYGNVFDNHGWEDTVASESLDQISWFRSDKTGLTFSTLSEEFVLSGEGGVITPLNKQYNKISSYGSFAWHSSVQAGFSTIFIQQGGQFIYEYVADALTQAPSGRVLNEFHLGYAARSSGFEQIAYTETRVPVVWAVGIDGQLFSCTYRRTSRFMSSPPDMAAWSRHRIGDLKRTVKSACVLSPFGVDTDYLYLATSTDGATNPAGPANGVERLMPFWLLDENTL